MSIWKALFRSAKLKDSAGPKPGVPSPPLPSAGPLPGGTPVRPDQHEGALPGSRFSSWSDLCGALQAIRALGARLLESVAYTHFPYQVMFLALHGGVDQPSWFSNVPFGPVPPRAVETARRYIDNPPVPGGLFRQLMSAIPTQRYKIASDGQIYRDPSVDTYALDMAICQVAGCLRGRSYNFMDPAQCSRFAVEAVLHYANLPIVAYFLSLPAIHDFLTTKRIHVEPSMLPSSTYTLAIYKGTEGLLLDIYDQLGQGQFITDDLIKTRVESFFSTSIVGGLTSA